MAFDLVTETAPGNDPAALMSIRFPDTDAAQAAAAAMKLQDMTVLPPTGAAQILDEIKQKQAGGTELTSEERVFLARYTDQLNSQPAVPAIPEVPADPNAAHVAKIDAITVKINAGQDLTPEEQTYIDAIEGAPAVPDKIYRVGGQEFTSVQMVEEMAKDMGVTPESLAPLGPDALGKMVDNYHAKRNQAEWQGAYTHRDQNLAKQRRQVGEIASRLMTDAQVLQTQIQEAQVTVTAVEALAAKNIDINDVRGEDGQLDPQKYREVNKVLDAREQLPSLKQKINTLRDQSVQTEQRLAVQKFRDFQEGHPQYRLASDIVDAVAAMQSGSLAGDDLTRVVEMVEIMRAADASRIHPDDVYEYRKNARQLAVNPGTNDRRQSGTEPARFAKGNTDREKLLARLQAKRTQFQGAVGGGGALRSVAKSPKQQATETIAAASRAALGVAGPNVALSEAGY